MARMLNRSRYTPCGCHTCRDSTPHANGQNRLREKRAWREDVRDLPQGESWLQDEFDAHRMNDGYWRWDDESLDSLPYWMAMKCLDAIYDHPDELPPGFDGAWSTDSAHVVLMRKRNRMARVHDSLRVLERAADGNRYAQAVIKHSQFEHVIE